jgi:hypothetical protein
VKENDMDTKHPGAVLYDEFLYPLGLPFFTSKESMAGDFGIAPSQLDDCEILYAWYNAEDYEGIAFVLFEQDGRLFEVNASHCSCHGLESQGYHDEPTQWQPEPVFEAELWGRKRTMTTRDHTIRAILWRCGYRPPPEA